MTSESVGHSERWRVTVLVNEHGSMVAERGPGVRPMDVMPVAEHEAEIAARRQALDAALKSLDALTEEKEVSEGVVKLLRARHEIRANQLPDSLDPGHHDVSAAGTALTRELIAAERQFIHDLLRDGQITDETRRRIERDLDLEEASLANREYRGVPL